jgi:hypothetical protein
MSEEHATPKVSKTKSPLVIIAQVFGWILGFGLGRIYPGILFQLIIAYISWWLGKKLFAKVLRPSPANDPGRKRAVYILSALGLLGLISPIVGFLFSLPAYLIATESITADNPVRNRLVSIGAVATAICIINAALGVVMFATPQA